MILVYSFTVLITGAWVLKSVNDKQLIIKRTPLDIPLLLFLGANILSTIFSIDTHTSFWGYYSRLNGGLLSTISYLLLYWAYCSNMDKKEVLTTLKFGLASGFLISLWAIMEHFGVSPSCLILRGELNASCWIQDVQARVFATLGQPNWLAAYLAMLIFPAFYFFLTAKDKLPLTTYYLLLTTYYLAFTFTYSRGPTLGLIAGMVVFFILYFIQNTRKIQQTRESANQRIRLSDTLISPILRVLLSFLIINILFGSALTSFRLVSKFAPPPRPAVTLPSASVTQLETGGTESGQIRFIVWQGALDIFRVYPFFGSGLETFAYSYYQYRPISHNLTSEWDFLYNKAHNEYLNYLATTGIVGFGTYMAVILTFVFWCLKIKNSETGSLKSQVLITSLLAAYICYLIYNFFLFSVVIIAVFFFLFPALSFILSDATKPLKLPLFNFLYKRQLYTKAAKVFIVLVSAYSLFSIYKIWLADTIFNQGEQLQDLGNAGRAYNLLSVAASINKNEPFYKSELAYTAAAASVALKDIDATLSAQLKNEANTQMEKVLNSNPKNISFLRTAIRTYFELSALDPKYIDKTLQALDQAISLAPTDPKLYYNKALILESLGNKDDAIKVLQKTLELKPNYLEVKEKLKESATANQ